MGLQENLVGAATSAAGAASKIPGFSGSEPYQTDNNNWYKALPYGFSFFNRDATSDSVENSEVLYLPILPSNIQTVTHYATNIVTTLYGVVEEHSEVRYYDITISGTTGFGPRFIGSSEDPNPVTNNNASTGRSAFSSASLSDSFGGFLPEISNTISQVGDVISDITGEGNKSAAGLSPDLTGYAAFHKLYKFFLRYKVDAAGSSLAGGKRRKTHPLRFLNYKDSIKYDCVPMAFTLERSAESPMLYNYNIKLRCYNLRGVSEKPAEQDLLARLGIGSATGQSLFSDLSGATTSAATLVSQVF
jgi:hypothetical protein